MPIDINLLPTSYNLQEVRVKKNKQLERLSIIALSLMIFLVAGVFLAWNIQSRRLVQIKAEVESLEEQVNGYKDIDGKVQILKAKLTSITTIVNRDPKFETSLGILSGLLSSSQVFLDDLSISENQKVTFGASAPTSSEASMFFDLFKSDSQSKQIFADATLDAITGAKDGSYKFSISASIKK